MVTIIAIAAVKLARATNKRDPALWVIAARLCGATVAAGAEIAWLVLPAGGFGAVYYGGERPTADKVASVSPLALLAAVKGLAWSGSGVSTGALGWFFFTAGAFTSVRASRSSRSRTRALSMSTAADRAAFRDAVAMGLISPGPVVIMATFAGYLVYGLAGAVIATLCVFLPALILVILPGPLIRRHERNERLLGFIKGATAAASGASPARRL